MAEFIADFHFLRPLWFIALLPVLVLFFLFLKRQKQSGQWQSLIAPHLLPFLIDGRQLVTRQRWAWFILLIWLITITALAGPAWKKLPEPVERDTAALIIVWDQSMSMLAEDIKPSRTQRSRLKIIDLLESRREGLTGLIAYSGESYAVSPLTDDVDTISNLLPALSPDVLPTRGSNIEMAFEMANELLAKAGVQKGDILVITDEIHSSAFADLRDQILASSHQLTIWGVGTTAGAPIPLRRGGFANKNGNIVVAKLNEAELQRFASDTGCYYVPMVQTDSDISTIEQLFKGIKQNTELTERLFDQWFEHGQLLILCLLPLLAAGFRKGWLLSFSLIFPLTFFSPEPVYAIDLKSWFVTPDQQAQKLLKNDDFESAANTFEDPSWKAAAQYKAGQYEQASETFSSLESNAQNLYNEATNLTRLGNYDEAIKKFDEALKINPDLAAAQTNKSIAEKLKELQQAQQQQGDHNDGEDGEQSEQNQQGEQNSSEKGNEQNQQNSENQQGEQQSDNQQASQSNKAPEDDPSNNQSGSQSQEDAEQEQESQMADEQDQQENQSEEEQAQMANQDEQQDQQNAEQDQQQMAQQSLAQTDQEPQSEEQQMLEQWLRKVPDDPSGLLRNKFAHQYRERQRSMRSMRNFTPPGAKEERY